MSEDKQDNEAQRPIIIHFQLDTQYDTRGHHAYFQAPDDFADMNPEERQKFLDEELALWHAEQVETSWAIYEGHEAAEREARGQRGSRYSSDQLEERW